MKNENSGYMQWPHGLLAIPTKRKVRKRKALTVAQARTLPPNKNHGCTMTNKPNLYNIDFETYKIVQPG